MIGARALVKRIPGAATWIQWRLGRRRRSARPVTVVSSVAALAIDRDINVDF